MIEITKEQLLDLVFSDIEVIEQFFTDNGFKTKRLPSQNMLIIYNPFNYSTHGLDWNNTDYYTKANIIQIALGNFGKFVAISPMIDKKLTLAKKTK
jgi:hypothetical protein